LASVYDYYRKQNKQNPRNHPNKDKEIERLLSHPKAHKVYNIKGATPADLLNKPQEMYPRWASSDFDEALTKHTLDLIHSKTLQVLKLRGVDINKLIPTMAWSIKGRNDRTPAHKAAELGHDEVLNHPKAWEVKDGHSNTPAHLLASRLLTLKSRLGLDIEESANRLLSHPNAHKVQNMYGHTPADILNHDPNKPHSMDSLFPSRWAVAC
jgi:hypothetical protein